MILVGTLKGAGDTQFLLRVSLFLSFMLGLFSWLSVNVWSLDVYGCWTLIVLWCLLAAVIYMIRFWKGKWRSMRVIEQPGDVDAAVAATAE
jgi:multidrug resistance protein, MATE family